MATERNWVGRGALVLGLALGLVMGPLPALADEDEDDDLALELVPIAEPDNGEPASEDASDPEAAEDAEPAQPEPTEPEPAQPEPAQPEPAQPEPAQPAIPTPAPSPSIFDEADARLRLSAEHGFLAPAEGENPSGLLGLNVDVHLNEWWHIGVGGYAAAMGPRGGFFAGGFQGGVRFPLVGPLSLEAGALVGGGGGANAAVGTGLLLRPQAGFRLDLGANAGYLGALSLNVAYLYFPTGSFSETTVGVTFEVPWPTLALGGIGSRPTAGLGEATWGASARAFRFTGHSYWVVQDPEAAVRRSPQAMVGFEYREWFTRNVFATIEPRMSASPATAGLAEFTVGAGFGMGLDPEERVSVFGSAGAGAAGGGGTDTGGGLLLRAVLGLDVDLPGPARLGLDGGIQDAPMGGYRAFSAGVRIGIAEQFVRTRTHSVRRLTDEDVVESSGWRVRANNATYFDVSLRDDDTPLLNLLGFKVDHLLGDHLYLSAQVAAPYTGGTYAFSTLAAAVGGRSPEWNGVRLAGEARVGTAGAGMVPVGGGLFVQPMGGFSVDVTEALSLELLGGWMYSPSGEMSSPAVDFGVVYSFTTPRLRPR
jgi:hypothetical protein